MMWISHPDQGQGYTIAVGPHNAAHPSLQSEYANWGMEICQDLAAESGMETKLAIMHNERQR